jgi:hypothetical protein
MRTVAAVVLAACALIACKQPPAAAPVPPPKSAPPASAACTEAARQAPHCAGIGGIGCDGGLRCIDDPCDDCDPDHGGADCAGICVPR